MPQHLIRQALFVVPTLLGVMVLVFIVMRVAPGDVALSMLVGPQGQGQVNESVYQQLRQQLGLDKPLFLDVTDPLRGSQFADWITGVVRGDWGESIQTDRSVLEEIAERLPVTLELAVMSVIISLIVGVPAGMLMAV